jgi:hypothetical protein
MIALSHCLVRSLLFVVSLTCGFAACAAEEGDHLDGKPTKLDVKLTASWYRSSDGNDANDLNLRGNYGDHAAWLGLYRDHTPFQQSRAGYEYTQHLDPAQIVWSAQAASGGFLGGSITSQFGDPLFGIVGFGRTNLKNYYNLNFDPNDAITLGVGSHLNPNTDVSLYQVRDDRLDTRQRITHLYLHRMLSGSHRYSIDGTYKSGLNSDGNFITGYGLTLTVAYHQVFFRLARDQYANFGPTTQTRVSLGTAF